MSSRAGAVLGAALAGALSTVVLAGSFAGGSQQRPVFRANVELVEVDVVVVDKAGKPVHGLTPSDFVVLDRRKPQSVETFQEVKREPRPDDLPPLPAATRVDVASNTSTRASRLVVMVLDDLHTYRGRDKTVKEIARQVVNDLGPQSTMALIQTGGEHGVEVTEDRSRLLEAIDKFKGRRAERRPIQACDDPKRPTCNLQDFEADMSLYKSLQDAARILGGGDRRRKAFVLVSENLAKELTGIFGVGTAPDREPRDSSAYAMATGEGVAEALAAIPVPAVPHHDNGLLDMMEAMRKGGVATYAIDPRGEVTPQELLQECFPGFGEADDPCLGRPLTAWNACVRQSQRGLEVLAGASGGFAVVNTDDFTSGVGRIVSDLDNYYLLGFYTSDTTTKGYRRLQVQVKGRPDLTLRYRQGYQLDRGTEEKKNTDPLSALVGTPLPAPGLPMRLHAVPMPYSNRETRVAVTLELTVPRRDIQGEGPQLLDDIRFGFYAIDLKGAKVREQFGRGAKIALSPRPGLTQPPDEVTYDITSVLQIPPGRYQIRASAISAKLEKSGSVYLSIDVPDFSKEALALTDLLIAYADGPHVPIARTQARSIVPAANVLPFDATLDRVFSPRDTLRLFFRAVQRRAVPLVATISAITSDGKVALTFDRALPARDPASLDIKLPLHQLVPGAYRLEVKVSDGSRQARREVGFVVR